MTSCQMMDYNSVADIICTIVHTNITPLDKEIIPAGIKDFLLFFIS